MNKKLMITVATMALAPAIALANPLPGYCDSLFVFGQKPPNAEGMSHSTGHPEENLENLLPPYVHGIKLTEAQHKTIKALVQKAQASMQANKKAMMEYHQSIQTQALSKNLPNEKLSGMVKKQVALFEKTEINMARLSHDIFEVLTPEQQQQAQVNHFKFTEHLKTDN